MATPALLHMHIKAVIGQIGLPTHKPAEGGKFPFENLIPGAKPVQHAGGTGPEFVVMFLCLKTPALDHGVDELACSHEVPLLVGSIISSTAGISPHPVTDSRMRRRRPPLACLSIRVSLGKLPL